MSIFQEYVGLNQNKTLNNDENKKLQEGSGYYLINDIIPLEDIRKILKDLLLIEKKQLITTKISPNSSELGQIRSPFLDSEFIRKLLCSDLIIELVKKHLVGNGICHLLNGQIIRQRNIHNQSLWHRDFNKVHISKPIVSFNVLFMLGEYLNIEEFSTLQKKHSFAIIPGSQSFYGLPSESLFKQKKIISIKPGSLIIFNSQLWHKVLSGKHDQMFLNMMFTEPFIKQQINLLGSTKDWINKNAGMESDLARLLGWWSRSPKDINEFRNPPDNIRTYRSNQG